MDFLEEKEKMIKKKEKQYFLKFSLLWYANLRIIINIFTKSFLK